MAKYPKFEKALQDKTKMALVDQAAMPGYGIIIDYDPTYNRASVMMSNSGSDEIGELLTDVPCPTHIGLQMAAPTPGYPCFVIFKDNTSKFPVITHYFNHIYEQIDYRKQTKTNNTIPRYILGM